MAKNESTAVNEMLARLATMKPLPPNPSDDIMFTAPKAALAAPAAGTPRGRGGEAKPPRRARAANGTPMGMTTMQGLGAAPAAMPPASPEQPAPAATMQGLGPAVQRAMAAPPPPPPARSRPPTAQSLRLQQREMAVPPPPPPVRSQELAAPLPPPPARSQERAVLPPPPPTRSQAMAAQPEASAAPLPARRRTTPAPPSMPVAAPFETGALPPAASLLHASPAQAVSPSMAAVPAAASASMVAEPSAEWLAQARAGLEASPAATLQLRRRSLVQKLAAPVIAVAAMGALAGYLVLGREAGERASAPAATAAMAPAPAVAAPTPAVAAPTPAIAAPAPAVAAPAPARPTFVDVMIVSSPAGATVTLVDRGKTSFIGTTPISTALDPSRQYELVFSQPGMPARIEPIDPSTTRRVDVQLGEIAPAAAKAERAPAPAAPQVAPAPAAPQVAQAPAAPAISAAPRVAKTPAAPVPPAAPRAEKSSAVPAAPPAEKAVAAAPAPAGDGILMIASKPPCEIFIDGKPTGLTTPQREIALPAGNHKVTLVNKAESITKTIAVQISTGQPTKVIQDLMK